MSFECTKAKTTRKSWDLLQRIYRVTPDIYICCTSPRMENLYSKPNECQRIRRKWIIGINFFNFLYRKNWRWPLFLIQYWTKCNNENACILLHFLINAKVSKFDCKKTNIYSTNFDCKALKSQKFALKSQLFLEMPFTLS